MKKFNGMMYVGNSKKCTDACTCSKCKKSLTVETAYYYVDDCNYAITNNAPPYCKDCYNEVYKKTNVDMQKIYNDFVDFMKQYNITPDSFRFIFKKYYEEFIE